MIIPVKTNRGEYNIYLKRGILSGVENYLKLDRKVLIVTDDGVPEEYSKAVLSKCKEGYIYTLPQGEESKSFENYKLLLKFMVEKSFTRSDCVVAVGGGVMGDLAGFVAASFMRGIDFYNIPTTVLSQVDSSIGGKVAIDFEGYKNIVGAFYPPKAVVIDPDTLKTLPERQISNGLCEAVKMSMTSNSSLFELFENCDILPNIEKIIEESLKIKKYVVEADGTEKGLRKILNFGHTLGHAIESENIGKLYHGECVAVGMLYFCGKEPKQRLIKVLKKLNVPTDIEISKEKIAKNIAHDKKKSGQKITIIFVEKIGEYKMKERSINELLNEVNV